MLRTEHAVRGALIRRISAVTRESFLRTQYLVSVPATLREVDVHRRAIVLRIPAPSGPFLHGRKGLKEPFRLRHNCLYSGEGEIGWGTIRSTDAGYKTYDWE